MLKIPVQISLKTDMNPFELWYRTNSKVSGFIDDYYQENIFRVSDPDLRRNLDITLTRTRKMRFGALKAQTLPKVYKRRRATRQNPLR
jgi:hypothetical protein